MSNTTTITPDTREKLLDLISIIEKVPDAEWDMDIWKETTDCGTVGCAAYHYANARPESGLTIEGIAFFSPHFRSFEGYEALSVFFGIDNIVARRFFDPGRYLNADTTRQDVIERIREFLGDHP